MTATGAPSKIAKAGTGLFADRPYRKNEHVTYYSGTYSDDPCIEGDRVIELRPRLSIDGGGKCQSPWNRGDLINHSPKDLNCRFAWCTTSPKPLRLMEVVTTKPVDKGAEFYVDYGPYFQFPTKRQ